MPNTAQILKSKKTIKRLSSRQRRLASKSKRNDLIENFYHESFPSLVEDISSKYENFLDEEKSHNFFAVESFMNFLVGASSITNAWPYHFKIDLEPISEVNIDLYQSAESALYSDWLRLGGDFWAALEKVENVSEKR